MKYRDAVDQLHVPRELKEKTLRAIETARSPRRAAPRRWLTATAAVAVVLVAALCVQLFAGGDVLGKGATALAVAQYPALPAPLAEEDYIDPATGERDEERYWAAYYRHQEEYDKVYDYHTIERADETYMTSLGGFSRAAMRRALEEAQGDNLVYSPANVYMALALLTELTGGSTRQQLLDALGVEDMALLREQTHRLWRQLYYDDDQRVTRLANSLWLDREVDAKQDTLDLLAENYFASAYHGEMGSKAMDKALRDWANQQTGNLLKDHVDGLSTDPNDVLALLSTVYFRARWYNEFDPAHTQAQDFHNADGSVSTVDFMRQTGDRTYLWSDKFSAVSLGLGGQADMTLILPDDGVTPQGLLADEEALALLLGRWGVDDPRWDGQTAYAEVALSMPKFDVSSDLDLGAQLQDLGITEVFTPGADFTSLSDTVRPQFTSARHAARVTVDEEGCTATAIVELLCTGMPPQPDQRVDFVLDRPFLFAVTGAEGMPLFVGVVNRL